MIALAIRWLRANERPWIRDMEWRDADLGLARQILRYMWPFLAVSAATVLCVLALLWKPLSERIGPSDRATLTLIRETGVMPKDLAPLAAYLVSRGEVRLPAAEHLLKLASSIQLAADPDMRLAQLAWTVDFFGKDVDGYIETIRYVASLRSDVRKWLVSRPEHHWIELSRRFAGIEANGPGLVSARYDLITEEAKLRQEISYVQNRLAQRRACRRPLEEAMRCADAAAQPTLPQVPVHP